MHCPITPAFAFDFNDPGTSPRFILILLSHRSQTALRQLRHETFDLLTGGCAAGCLAVLLVGLTDSTPCEQTRQMRQLGRRWGVTVEAAESVDVARRLGSRLLTDCRRFFQPCREPASPGLWQLACMRRVMRGAMKEFERQRAADAVSVLVPRHDESLYVREAG